MGLANGKGYTASLAVIKQYRELVIYPLSVYRAPILFKIWLYFRRLAKFLILAFMSIFSIYRCTTSSNYTQCLVTKAPYIQIHLNLRIIISRPKVLYHEQILCTININLCTNEYITKIYQLNIISFIAIKSTS